MSLDSRTRLAPLTHHAGLFSLSLLFKKYFIISACTSLHFGCLFSLILFRSLTLQGRQVVCVADEVMGPPRHGTRLASVEPTAQVFFPLDRSNQGWIIISPVLKRRLNIS